jgi:hypothetical protein
MTIVVNKIFIEQVIGLWNAQGNEMSQEFYLW